jgi:hypothetical protein
LRSTPPPFLSHVKQDSDAATVLLGYCLTTLEAGYRMCGTNCETGFFGVDENFDTYCNYVERRKGLRLYFREV